MDSADIEALAKLFHEAYVGTVDYEGESEQEALAVVVGTFEGEFGPFVAEASMLIERSGVPVSAAFVTMFRGKPLLAFAVTSPDHKGQGLCQACVSDSMAALALAGHQEMHLFVTSTNTPALAAYSRLGFVCANEA